MTEELPDNIRIPLHSLQADIGYLVGRVAIDVHCISMVVDSIKERLSQIETAAYGICANLKEATEDRDAYATERYAAYAVGQENMRDRIAKIINSARFGEIDTDFRSIVNLIKTLELDKPANISIARDNDNLP